MYNTCIAILYPGDMGHAIAKELISANFRVSSASNGRSRNSIERVKNAGIEDVKTIENIVKEADYIISLTNAEASISVAKSVAAEMELQKKYPVFIDMNSNNPETVSEIQKIITNTKGLFINAAVLGNSNKVATNAKIIVSGTNTKQFIDTIGQVFHVKNVGSDITSASAFKLLFAMVNKSMNGLFFETMIAASHYGFIDELNNELESFLPGTYQDLVKTTPTYPQHIKRRITEMDELVKMLKTENLPFHYALAAQETFEQIDKEKILENKTVHSVRDVFDIFKK